MGRIHSMQSGPETLSKRLDPFGMSNSWTSLNIGHLIQEWVKHKAINNMWQEPVYFKLAKAGWLPVGFAATARSRETTNNSYHFDKHDFNLQILPSRQSLKGSKVRDLHGSKAS